MVDDGSGAKEIFRVDNFDLVQVPDEDHGKFYSGDCYVILYAYSTGTQDRFIIYFWLVRESRLFCKENMIQGYWKNEITTNVRFSSVTYL